MNIVFTPVPDTPQPDSSKPRMVAARVYRDGRKAELWYYPTTRRLSLQLSVDGEIQHYQAVKTPFEAMSFMDSYRWTPRSKEYGRNSRWNWN